MIVLASPDKHLWGKLPAMFLDWAYACDSACDSGSDEAPDNFLLVLYVQTLRGAPSSFLLLVVGPGPPGSFLLLVAMPGAPSSVLAPSSGAIQLVLCKPKQRCPTFSQSATRGT